MRFFMKTMMLISIAIIAATCAEDEVLLAPSERIIGTWTVESGTVFGSTIPNGASILKFNKYGENGCYGVDYNANDQTSGEFIMS